MPCSIFLVDLIIAYPLYYQFVERIKKYCDICGGPATFIQVCKLLYVS